MINRYRIALCLDRYATRQITLWILVVVLAVYVGTTKLVYARSPVISGWIEDAYIFPERFRLRAKIDTGAEHSSINAYDMTLTRDGNDQRVRFQVTNRDGQTTTIDRTVHRIATITRHSGKSQARPVIFLDICLGGIKKKCEVNLIDRTEFKYQLLIGRSFLQSDFLVDPGNVDLLDRSCHSKPQAKIPQNDR
jgi:hypothetical protein